MSVAGKLRFIREDGSVEQFDISWDDPHEAMRSGNAALPADDPRKITREDVVFVTDGAYAAASEFPLDPDALALEARLHAIATKLAALLPPEA